MPRKGKTEEQHSAAQFLPKDHSLASLREAAAHCQGCPLYKDASQTVFGEGPEHARALFVGEQPGDIEDKQGRPFVGPAGRLLDKALEDCGIDRSKAYFTNAVKHFKFEWRGKRRVHQTPRKIEVDACLPWLQAEINELQPQVIVLLGATAAQALLGKDFRITKSRGQFLESNLAPYVMATVHPSSILRAPDSETRAVERQRFVNELKLVAKVLQEQS